MAGELPVDLSEFDQASELRLTAQRLQRQLAQAKAKTADLIESVYQAAKDASVIIGAPPAVPSPQPRSRKGKPEVAIVHASDWQIGKRTESYNSEVAAERVDRLAYKVEKLTEIHRSDHPVKVCHLFLGGDMVEGVSIFPGQAWEVDSSDYEQLFRTVDFMHSLVRRLLGVFQVVQVDCEDGNHGRLGRKGDHPGVDNLDLAGESRCRLVLPRSWYQLPVIGNLQPLLVHGDEVKGFGGNTPLFGIIKKCNNWASGVLPAFQDVWMGHFHLPATAVMARGTFIRMNGTLESDNQYAREFMAATGRPCQRLSFAEPERGMVTADHMLYLDD